VGLCAASLGAHATLTDLACVLPVLEHHLRLNRSVISDAGGQVDCHTLHWGRDEDLNGLPRYDLIVAADVRPIQCGRELVGEYSEGCAYRDYVCGAAPLTHPSA
jgi:hypothetical protein